jgi:hypothetical protein
LSENSVSGLLPRTAADQRWHGFFDAGYSH